MRPFSKQDVPPQAKILLIKLRSIGDVIYNTAVYAPLKKCFPNARLTVVVEPASYDIVRYHPDVDEVICFDKSSFVKRTRFYLDLIRGKYDVAIDMHEGPRGALMCFLSRAPLRIGNKMARRSFLYNTKLDFSDLNPQYPIDFQVGLIKKMGVEFDRVEPVVHIAPEKRENAFRLMAKHDMTPEDAYCIIHPGARIYDQWDPARFARLAEYFHKHHNLKVLLTCGPGQEKQAQDVLKLAGETPVIFIMTDLQELAAITEKARFVICHNGGYMHLAAILGTPVVALFGLTDPNIWKPMGGRQVILHRKLDCFPCTRHTIREECLQGDPECKRLITVEDVIAGAEQFFPG